MALPAPGNGNLRQLRIMVGAFLAAPVLVLVAMWFVLGETLTDPTPWPFVIGLVALTVIGDGVLRIFGYRTVILPRGLSKADAMARSRLSDLPMLLSLALAFLTPGGFYLVLFGCALTLNLLVVHVWPTQRSVERTIDSLELDGTRSHLREALGLTR